MTWRWLSGHTSMTLDCHRFSVPLQMVCVSFIKYSPTSLYVVYRHSRIFRVPETNHRSRCPTWKAYCFWFVPLFGTIFLKVHDELSCPILPSAASSSFQFVHPPLVVLVWSAPQNTIGDSCTGYTLRPTYTLYGVQGFMVSHNSHDALSFALTYPSWLVRLCHCRCVTMGVGSPYGNARCHFHIYCLVSHLICVFPLLAHFPILFLQVFGKCTGDQCGILWFSPICFVLSPHPLPIYATAHC